MQVVSQWMWAASVYKLVAFFSMKKDLNVLAKKKAKTKKRRYFQERKETVV